MQTCHICQVLKPSEARLDLSSESTNRHILDATVTVRELAVAASEGCLFCDIVGAISKSYWGATQIPGVTEYPLLRVIRAAIEHGSEIQLRAVGDPGPSYGLRMYSIFGRLTKPLRTSLKILRLTRRRQRVATPCVQTSGRSFWPCFK